MNPIYLKEEYNLEPFAGNKLIISEWTSEKYNLLAGDRIDLKINERKYRFLVAGIASAQGLFRPEGQNITMVVSIDNLKLAIEEEQYQKEEKQLAQQDKIIRLQNQLENLEYKLYSRNYLKEDQVVLDIPKGVVQGVNCANGDVVTKNSDDLTLITIMDLNDVIIEADVPEEFIKDVNKGAQVKIIPLANDKREYHGEVTIIYNLAVEKNGETIVPIEVSINDLDQFLLPNFNVDVEITKAKTNK